MTPAELENIGQALFPGRGWKAKLADALGVHRSTVEDWYDGKWEISGARQHQIFDLVETRLKDMKQMFNKQIRSLK